MATSTENTARIEIPTSALLRLLADGKQFAYESDDIPGLNSVSFEFADEDLLVISTDRYTLGIGRYPVGEKIVQPLRSIRLDAVTQIEKAFKPARGTDPLLAATFGDEGLAIETTLTLDGQPTQRVAVPWSENHRVPWRSIVTDSASAEVTYGAFTPHLLARFMKVEQRNQGAAVVVWPSSESKPWRITVGDSFTGVIMPKRLPSGADSQQWTPGAANVRPEPKRRGKAAA